MWLCMDCLSLGYCKKITCSLISDRELHNTDFVEDVRTAARELKISPGQWRDFIYDAYRDYPGRVLGPGGEEVFLDLEVFEADSVREWFRDWVFSQKPLCRDKKLRCESYERVRIIGTLLKAANPQSALMWGIRAANDNRAPAEP